jgi:hypothetical protein
VIDAGRRAVLERDLDRVGGAGTVARRHRIGGREGAGQAVVQAGLLDVVGQRVAERGLSVGQRDPVLRALGARDRRHHGGQVEAELLGVARRLVCRIVPQALLLGVRLDERELLARTTGQGQVVQGVLVDGEDRAGRPELR